MQSVRSFFCLPARAFISRRLCFTVLLSYGLILCISSFLIRLYSNGTVMAERLQANQTPTKTYSKLNLFFEVIFLLKYVICKCSFLLSVKKSLWLIYARSILNNFLIIYPFNSFFFDIFVFLCKFCLMSSARNRVHQID